MQAGTIGWFVGMALVGLIVGAAAKYYVDNLAQTGAPSVVANL